MDRLWAPWRVSYIRAKKEKKCIFCFRRNPKGKYVVFKTKHSSCMLNTFPYNNGHLLISPLRHVRELGDLNKEEALDIFEALAKAKKLLDLTLQPHGYNIGINLSQVAGAGITGHLHIHLVPRWRGDTNFMPLIGNTKLISQSLDELFKLLKRKL